MQFVLLGAHSKTKRTRKSTQICKTRTCVWVAKRIRKSARKSTQVANVNITLI